MINKNKLLNKIEDFKNDNLGISIRKLLVNNIEVIILYIAQLTDKESLSNNIIKPILQNGKDELLTIEKIFSSVIYIDDVSMENNEDKMIEYILKGNSVLLIPDYEKYIVANTLKIEKRGIEPPMIDTTLRGAKDSFTENLDDNISLIRYRIKDDELRINNFSIGRRTKTNVALIYMEDIANENSVKEVKEKLENINIDGVLESGYVQKLISDDTFNLFPQVGIVERSDEACANILEGRIVIIIEGSNLALIMPKTFIEFLDAGDDHYSNIYLGIFSKVLRIAALTISLTISSLYVAVVSFHPDILPPQYILSIASSRVTVPFNAFVEAVVMEFVAEILREASIRLPKQIGPAIGIVGAIVIGQAAVAAGLVSPLMVIIVALSSMCSFVLPDFTIMNPIRILKFFLIFTTGILGLFGFVMGLTFILIYLCSLESFGVPYVAPISPFNFTDLKNYIFSDVTLSKKRPKYLNTRDKTRK